MIAKIGDWVNPRITGASTWVKNHRRELWLGGCSALVAWSAYNVGLIRGSQEQPLIGTSPAPSDAGFTTRDTATTSTNTTSGQGSAAAKPDHTDLRVFASKNSTAKKYYYSWCSSRVKEANKTWFTNEQSAQAKGYTLASGCK